MTIQNWRNVPTTTPMPGGAYDPVHGGWKHVGMGSWNGAAWTYQIHHFSEQDLNPDEYGEWVLLMSGGQDPNGGATICGGSSISVGGGSVNQNIRLPTYRHRGRDYGVTLNYSSGLAGSRTLGTGPTSTKQAVPSGKVGVSVSSMSLKRLCLPQNNASQVIAVASSGAGPLVYGPSANGALATLAAQLGGTTLTDLDKPMDQTWEQFSMQALDAAAQSGQAVVFDLSNMSNVQGVLNGTAYASSVTSAELRYIAANWDRFFQYRYLRN